MAETLQDFLISIGYKVDEPAQRKVKEGLKENTFLAVELGKQFLSAAQQVEQGIKRMAAAMDDLYFASQRTNSAVVNIKALGYAASQLGSSAGAALSGLESIAKLMATNPAGESFLRSLGVQTRDAKGQLLDTTKIMSNLGTVLRGMPLPTANYIASFLGIDYKTLIAMREGMTGFEAEYQKMYAMAHINSAQAAKDSNYLMTQVRGLGAAFDVLGDKVASNMARRLGDDIRRFRLLIANNFEAIAHVIEVVATAFLNIAEVLTILLVRTGEAVAGVIRWFQSLDRDTQQIIAIFGALLLAIRLVNIAFLLSPVGIVLMLAAALVALFDDYETWRKGGKSLIDWSKWQGEIAAAMGGINEIGKAFGKLWKSIRDDLLPALGDLGTALGFKDVKIGDGFTNFIKALTEDITSLINALTTTIKLMSAVARGDWAAVLEQLGGIQAALPDMAANRAANVAAAEAGGGGWVGAVRRHLPTWLFGVDATAGGGAGTAHPQANMPVDMQRAGQESYSFWKGKGFSDAGAASMAAQEMGESGGNPAARGDHGNSHGLYQWDQGRRARILKETGINVDTASTADQREAMFREMRDGLDPQTGQAYNAIRNATTLSAGVRLGVTQIERSADQDNDITKRMGFGQAILAGRPAGGALALPAPPTLTGLTDAQRYEAIMRLRGMQGQRALEAPAPLVPATPGGPGGSGVALNQTTTIHVNGAQAPGTVGEAVRAAQERVNESASRNLAGAVR